MDDKGDASVAEAETQRPQQPQPEQPAQLGQQTQPAAQSNQELTAEEAQLLEGYMEVGFDPLSVGIAPPEQVQAPAPSSPPPSPTAATAPTVPTVPAAPSFEQATAPQPASAAAPNHSTHSSGSAIGTSWSEGVCYDIKEDNDVDFDINDTSYLDRSKQSQNQQQDHFSDGGYDRPFDDYDPVRYKRPSKYDYYTRLKKSEKEEILQRRVACGLESLASGMMDVEEPLDVKALSEDELSAFKLYKRKLTFVKKLITQNELRHCEFDKNSTEIFVFLEDSSLSRYLRAFMAHGLYFDKFEDAKRQPTETGTWYVNRRPRSFVDCINSIEKNEKKRSLT